MLRIWFYCLIARLLGMTFAINRWRAWNRVRRPAMRHSSHLFLRCLAMLANEAKHERELIALIDEERLKYVGSVVLGLNDALVSSPVPLPA